MIRALPLIFTFAASLWAQTSPYPGALDTDQTLKVVANNCQAQLSASVATTDTTLVVSANTCIAANMLLTIDSEIISACSVSGNIVTVGNGSCPNVNGRGFNGTTAAAHQQGKLVSAFVDAWHFGALASATKAIETALGPNLLNVRSGQSYSATGYNFAAQSPGAPGSIAPGNNVVTLSPVPLGVNGTDGSHYLYVAGTGTPEACLITGGSGIAGASSGQIIINCAGSHSAGYTVASATGGVAEAQQAIVTSGVPGIVQITQDVTFHAGVIGRPGPSVLFVGTGSQGVYVRRGADYMNGDLFHNSLNAGWYFHDLFFSPPDGAKTGAAIYLQDGWLEVQNVQVYNEQYGVVCKGCLGDIANLAYTQIDFSYQPIAALLIGKGTFNSTNITVRGVKTGNGASYNPNTFVASLWFQGSDSVVVSDSLLGAGQSGIRIDNTEGPAYNVNLQFNGVNIIDVANDGILFYGNASTCADLVFSGVSVQGDNDGTAGHLGAGVGIDFGLSGATSCDHVLFSGMSVHGFYQQGVFIGNHTGDSLIFDGFAVYDNNRGNQAGYAGIDIADGTSRVTFSNGSSYNNPGGAGHQKIGLHTSGTLAYSTISNVSVYNNDSTQMTFSAPPTNSQVLNNLGYNPVGIASISPGSSPFTYTAGPTAEVVYITGGTVSDVSRSSTTVCSGTPCTVTLAPNTALVVTHTGAPTMVKDIQ